MATLTLLFASSVAAHPGRTDATGCHDVHTQWTAKDGTVYEPETRHCHHKLGEMKLDGKERLQDPDDKTVDPHLLLPPHPTR